MKSSPQNARGFTLLELLAVAGLIAVLAFFVAGALGGGGKTATLQSSQAILANLVTAARTKAMATGRKTRLLVHADPAQPERFLRLLVLQLGRQSGASPTDWDTVQAVALPGDTFVAPASLTAVVATPAVWKRVSDSSAELASDLFTNQTLTYAKEGDALAQAWTGVAFTPNGTLAALGVGPPPRGSIVLVGGNRRVPGSYAPGEPPVQFTEPPAVRGLVLSSYGIPALLNDRTSF